MWRVNFYFWNVFVPTCYLYTTISNVTKSVIYYFLQKQWLHFWPTNQWKRYQGKVDDIREWNKSRESLSSFWGFSIWIGDFDICWLRVFKLFWSSKNMHQMGYTFGRKSCHIHDICVYANVLHLCALEDQH